MRLSKKIKLGPFITQRWVKSQVVCFYKYYIEFCATSATERVFFSELVFKTYVVPFLEMIYSHVTSKTKG